VKRKLVFFFSFFLMCCFVGCVFAQSTGHVLVYPSSEDYYEYFVYGLILAAVVVGIVVFSIFYLRRGSDVD